MEVAGKKLAALLAAAFAAGVVVAASMYAPLGIISFNVLPSGGSGGSGSLYSKPFTVDLGNLTAGESGSFSGVASLSVPYDSRVKFEIEHDSMLEKVFSEFAVTVTVGDETFTLNLYGEDEYYIYLTAGNYTVTVTVEYTVRSNPEPGSYAGIVFLKAELEEDES